MRSAGRRPGQYLRQPAGIISSDAGADRARHTRSAAAASSCPRMVGVRVGQTLQVMNSDPTAHNVHSLSTHGNAFNVSQPMQRHGEQVSGEIRGCRDAHQVRHPLLDGRLRGRGATSVLRRQRQPTARSPSGACRRDATPSRRGTKRTDVLTRTVDVKAGQTADRRFRLHRQGKASPPPDVRDLVTPGRRAGDHADCRTLTRAGCASGHTFARRNPPSRSPARSG